MTSKRKLSVGYFIQSENREVWMKIQRLGRIFSLVLAVLCSAGLNAFAQVPTSARSLWKP